MSRITVMLVDDHPLVRQGMRQLLAYDTHYTVVAEAASGYEAIQQADRHQPRVILMDVQLPGLTGLRVVPILKKRLPKSAIIVLSSHHDDAHIYQAAMLGVAAYLTKEIAPEALVTTMDRVVVGEQPIMEMLLQRPALAARVLMQLRGTEPERRRAVQDAATLPLTLRETEVLDCILHGYSNRESADALFITEQTVKNHMTRLLGKFDATTRLDLVRHALQHGWMLVGSPAPEQPRDEDVLVAEHVASPGAPTGRPTATPLALTDTSMPVIATGDRVPDSAG